jgi:penicillin-binding protein 2
VEKHPSSVVPAGSVIKPLTVLLGLNEKLIAPNDRWQDVGIYRYGRGGSDKVPNYNGGKNLGLLTPQTAIQKSANTYMARIGERLVQQKKNPVKLFQNYTHQFGLGVKTGIDLPYENDGVEDYLSTAERYSDLAAVVQASFGQQEKYTTLQLAQYVSTLANYGKRLKPLIVDRITEKTDEGQEVVVKTFKPEVLNEVNIDKKYFDIVKQGMIMVTKQGGTAYSTFMDFPYTVAAKTGTSEQDIYIRQTYVDKDGKIKVKQIKSASGKMIDAWKFYQRVENATFISYAPAENPKLAVAVVVPEGGGTPSAQVIARKIYEIYDHYVGLTETPNPMSPTPQQEQR